MPASGLHRVIPIEQLSQFKRRRASESPAHDGTRGTTAQQEEGDEGTPHVRAASVTQQQAGTGRRGQRANVQNHVATEQRRRDRINEGCAPNRQAIPSLQCTADAFHPATHIAVDTWLCRRFDQLRELIPHRDKLDKASFLLQTVDYIRQLQVTPAFEMQRKTVCS